MAGSLQLSLHESADRVTLSICFLSAHSFCAFFMDRQADAVETGSGATMPA